MKVAAIGTGFIGTMLTSADVAIPGAGLGALAAELEAPLGCERGGSVGDAG